MTTYNLTANTTSSNDSDVQNVEQADTVIVSITAAWGMTVQSSSNCSVTLSGGGSNPVTITATVTFSNTGSYSVVLYQSFGGRTYTLTGTVSATVTITAPTISSVTNDNAKAANVTATVNLSANGSGGTLPRDLDFAAPAFSPRRTRREDHALLRRVGDQRARRPGRLGFLLDRPGVRRRRVADHFGRDLGHPGVLPEPAMGLEAGR